MPVLSRMSQKRFAGGNSRLGVTPLDEPVHVGLVVVDMARVELVHAECERHDLVLVACDEEAGDPVHQSDHGPIAEVVGRDDAAARKDIGAEHVVAQHRPCAVVAIYRDEGRLEAVALLNDLCRFRDEAVAAHNLEPQRTAEHACPCIGSVLLALAEQVGI